MKGLNKQVLLAVAALVAVAFSVAFGPRLRGQKEVAAVVVTLGDIQAVHAKVTAAGKDVRGVARFSAGDALTTSADGRARVRLDDGTTVVVDRETEIEAMDEGLELVRGRIFVKGGRAARSVVGAGGVTTIASANALAFERFGEDIRIYCADGEAIVSGRGDPARVRSGETAVVDAASVKVAPEKAFNDWTGGMATPWSATGRPRPAIGELWGRSSTGDGGSPLAVRLHDVQVRLEGEVAVTHIETTYFNGGSTTVTGDFSIAVPPGAIVSRFAVQRANQLEDGVVLVGGESNRSVAKLEWAGPGWTRGQVPSIPSGETVMVVLDYVEWLDVRDKRMVYRYPMVSDEEPPLIGELRMRVDASRVRPTSIAVGPGVQVKNQKVEFRQADLRPEADFVVELGVAKQPAGTARAHVASADEDDEAADPYFLVRADLPRRADSEGVKLAIVVDTSRSIVPSMLETSRALVESILEGLGAKDQVAIFTADQTSGPLSEPGLSPVDAERRKKLREQLASLRPGGASDIGSALERAADALGTDAADGMVIYVGDGRPTMGDVDFEAVRARLARRPAGIPRLGAVAVGPSANRFGFNVLVRGAGPVLGLADRSEAPEVAVALLTTALVPVVSGVEVELGPAVDRVYPRGPQVVPAGGTVTVVGRVRGKRPTSLLLRYRRAEEVVEETRRLVLRPAVQKGDIRRRWASERVRDIVSRGESVEIAADIARRARLLSPWTGFFVGSEGATTGPARPLLERARDPEAIALLGRDTAEEVGWSLNAGALLEPRPVHHDDKETFEALIAAAARRTLDRAMPGVRRCRAARAAARPDIEGPLVVRIELSGSGRVSKAAVRASRPVDDDPVLNRCVASLVSSLKFFDSGTTTRVTVEHELELPPAPDLRARKCSSTSRMPVALRVAVWRERLVDQDPARMYGQAKRSCEVPRWSVQRALLDLLLEKRAEVSARLELAKELEKDSHADAAAYVRRMVVRGARTPQQLAEVRAALVRSEPEPGKAFAKQFDGAKDDQARLAVVRRFLQLSPHDPSLRRANFGLLHALGEKELLLQAIYDVRQDPFADAAILADGASWLRRVGKNDEGLRAFGELVERAPRDPYARATAGDRLRDEGLFDEATTAYQVLVEMLPEDPAAAMRLGLAHAGAGRLDLATRTLARVAQTGGRTGDLELGQLASMVSVALLAEARGQAKGKKALQLSRRIAETPMPDAAAVVLVRSPALRSPVQIRVLRARPGADPLEAPPDLAAPTMGLFAQRVERGDGELRVVLRREPEIGPTLPVSLKLDLLELDEQRRFRKISQKTVKLPADGKDVEVRWSEEGGQ